MSILTGEPNGRVVFAWVENHGDRAVDKVVVIVRSCVARCARHHDKFVWSTARGDEVPVELASYHNAYTFPEMDQLSHDVFASVVSEDRDVVWTQRDGRWTRVPDLPEAETNYRKPPAPTTMPGPGESSQ